MVNLGLFGVVSTTTLDNLYELENRGVNLESPDWASYLLNEKRKMEILIEDLLTKETSSSVIIATEKLSELDENKRRELETRVKRDARMGNYYPTSSDDTLLYAYLYFSFLDDNTASSISLEESGSLSSSERPESNYDTMNESDSSSSSVDGSSSSYDSSSSSSYDSGSSSYESSSSSYDSSSSSSSFDSGSSF